MLFLAIALYPFDRKRKVVHAQCFWWADLLIALNPYWELRVSGLENIDKRKTYVIVANHQSMADIIIVYKTKMQFKWVAKDSLFKLPILGWELSLAKHINLTRGNFSSIKEVYKKADEWLASGVSVLFFPEGTRSESGDIGDFQNGAFKLAIKDKKPILPISISGTGNAIPKGSWLFTTRIPASLTILPPIDTSTLEIRDFGKLRDMVHLKLNEALAKA
jgi:1-acyl-sn-glycerol-3-phosphate acyltransferase